MHNTIHQDVCQAGSQYIRFLFLGLLIRRKLYIQPNHLICMDNHPNLFVSGHFERGSHSSEKQNYLEFIFIKLQDDYLIFMYNLLNSLHKFYLIYEVRLKYLLYLYKNLFKKWKLFVLFNKKLMLIFIDSQAY